MVVLHCPVPGWFGAQAITICPSLVLVLPARRGDLALLSHEAIHARQQRCGVLRWWWLYLTDEAFRFDQEMEAYKVQVQLQPWRLREFALALSSLYFLDLTYEEAMGLLTAHMTIAGQLVVRG